MRCICHFHNPECICVDDSQNAVELEAAESLSKNQFIGFCVCLALAYCAVMAAAVFYARPGVFRHVEPLKIQDRILQTDLDSRPQICFDSYLDDSGDDEIEPEDDGAYCI